MNQTSQLETNLQNFEEAIITLRNRPNLDSALYAILLSIDLNELFDLEQKNKGRVSPSEVKRYLEIINSCIGQFEKMIPNLNGQAYHVDLYIEQMLGRADIVSRMNRLPDHHSN